MPAINKKNRPDPKTEPKVSLRPAGEELGFWEMQDGTVRVDSALVPPAGYKQLIRIAPPDTPVGPWTANVERIPDPTRPSRFKVNVRVDYPQRAHIGYREKDKIRGVGRDDVVVPKDTLKRQ